MITPAVRRVGSIAIVHETLSQAVVETVPFDEIVDGLGVMVTVVSAHSGQVRVRRVGSFGVLPSETASALAMVLTEVLQNAVEHGYAGGSPDEPGVFRGSVRRRVGRLHLIVDDDGVGLPEGFTLERSTNLGLSIVRTLVESELGGQLELGPAPAKGTRAVIDLPLE